MTYDSRVDTFKHIMRVRNLVAEITNILAEKSAVHDESKLHHPEKTIFDIATPALKKLTYGTQEYKDQLATLGPALKHHYANNSHHPEYHVCRYIDDDDITINEEKLKDGTAIGRMDLMEIIEMLADWKAAGERHADGGDIQRSIDINVERFGIDSQLERILRNTARHLGW